MTNPANPRVYVYRGGGVIENPSGKDVHNLHRPPLLKMLGINGLRVRNEILVPWITPLDARMLMGDYL